MKPPLLLVLHGPNLNRLGQREPDIYGKTTLEDIDGMLRDEASMLGVSVEFVQSNHEGVLIDAIHHAADRGVAGILMNPGAFTHTSVALRDAVAAVGLPLVEVHLSNVHRREPFRHQSYFSDLALAVLCGLGAEGYRVGLRHLAHHTLAARSA